MIGTVIRKELSEHVLSLRFAVATLLTIGLVFVCINILIGDYAQKKDHYDINRRSFLNEAQSKDDMSSLQMEGILVEKSPEPMQVGYSGLAETDGIARVQTFFEPQVLGSLDKNPVLPLFPTPDILYVVATVLSLMAFVFSYDAIAGERESGTLKLMMSYSLPRDTVILGKWMGGFLSLVVPFIIALLAASILILFSSRISFEMIEWSAFGMGLLASLLFLSVVFSLGMFVSAWCARSSTAIIVLIFVWVCLVLMVPNVSPYVANMFSPVTPREVVEGNIREGIGNALSSFRAEMHKMFRSMERDWRRQGNWRGRGAVSDTARKELDDKMDELGQELKSNINKVSENQLRKFKRELERQIAVTKTISRLSPVSSYVYIVTDLAGTGVDQQMRFQEMLRDYQFVFRGYLDEKTGGQFMGGGRRRFMRGADRGYDISDIPMFDYSKEPLTTRWNRCLLDLCLLGVASIFLFMLAYVKFLRADVIE